MKRTFTSILLCFVSLLSFSNVQAYPVDIMQNSYSYYLNQSYRIDQTTLSETKRVTGLQAPVTDILRVSNPPYYTGESVIQASEFSLFARSAGAFSNGVYSNAFVSESLLFSPLANSQLSLEGGGFMSFTAYYCILFDETANAEIFNEAELNFLGERLTSGSGGLWEGKMIDTVIWGPGYPNINALLLSDHVYHLRMGVLTESLSDVWSNGVSANITTVPEPGTMILLAAGLVGIGYVKRKLICSIS